MKRLDFKTYLNFFLILCLIGFAVFYGVEKNEYNASRETEAKLADKRHIKIEDSLRAVINKEQEERLKLMRSAAAAHMTAQYERNRADKAHKEYEKIKFYAPRNDSERDSLRRAALGK